MSSDYQLLDFGDNEKLESFGGAVVRRQTPSAAGLQSDNTEVKEKWNQSDLQFHLDFQAYQGKSKHEKGKWLGEAPDPWRTNICGSTFSLRQTPTGQVGVFPEQASNWNWIANLPDRMQGMKALNLFAYTGGTTMALARKGVEVVHVDAAKSVVSWARENAKLSGLAEAPIRWIVEDVMTFMQRELKRGNGYDIVVADPPSFGRGPKKELWKIQSDLRPMLDLLAALTASQPNLLLLSCHTPGVDHPMLDRIANSCFNKSIKSKSTTESFELSIQSESGKSLPSGSCVRWFDL
ncbi:MAG: class I SAM-dependent methyltransferase [Mariniblastus sp.]